MSITVQTTHTITIPPESVSPMAQAGSAPSTVITLSNEQARELLQLLQTLPIGTN